MLGAGLLWGSPCILVDLDRTAKDKCRGGSEAGLGEGHQPYRKGGSQAVALRAAWWPGARAQRWFPLGASPPRMPGWVETRACSAAAGDRTGCLSQRRKPRPFSLIILQPSQSLPWTPATRQSLGEQGRGVTPLPSPQWHL